MLGSGVPGFTLPEVTTIAEGTRFDVSIERRHGALAPDEIGEEATGADLHGERLRVTVRIRDGHTRLVLQGRGAQYVTALSAGDTFTRSLANGRR